MAHTRISDISRGGGGGRGGGEHLVVLLARPISHTGTQYMDFVEIFNISLDLSTIHFTNLSGC